MNDKLKIAALQMVSSADLTENLATATRLIEQAAAQGAKLVLLPEYFCLISPDPTAKWAIAEEYGMGVIQQTLCQLAKKHQLWLGGGSLPLRTPDPQKVTNTLLLISPDGEVSARYDKIHLFSLHTEQLSLDENRTMLGGQHVVTAESPFGPIGLSICYDLRFPALYAQMGAVNLLLVPAAFTYLTGQDHWQALLQVRAVDNQCFVLAAAQGGLHTSGRQTWGHSMIVDPWGKVLNCLAHGEGVVLAEIDLGQITKVRHSLPVLRDRQILSSLTGAA